MTAPCAIEYILVTRWRGGKKGGQNRVCACDTRDRGVNKKLKREHRSETVVMPESGERKRNLTTLVLVKNFFALCCLGKIPGGAPFSQLHKSGNGSRVDRP